MTYIKNHSKRKPVVLCFSGHDPSGGAGIQADIEAISAQGVHAATIVTALTCQDTSHVLSFQAVNADKLQEQAEVLLKDMTVDVIKVGMTADVEVVKAIHHIIKQHEEIPVVLDPVLASGAGTSLSSDKLINAINTYLIPYCQLITPNIPEAIKLASIAEPNNSDINVAASFLLGLGSEHVLVTGTHADLNIIEHKLYHAHETLLSFKNERLPHEYHGSGCTLASSIAAHLAKGEDINTAIQRGLDYTFESLQRAHAPGQGQWLPDRLFQRNQDD